MIILRNLTGIPYYSSLSFANYKNMSLYIDNFDYKFYRSDRKFLVLTKREWHPGIIGIVAARIAEKFNLPTALLAEANDGNFRGSIRSNNKLMVKVV